MAKSTKQDFIDEMHAAGLRVTNARVQLFKALIKSDRPLDMDQLIAAASEAHFSNVYRSVDTMSAAGVIKAIPFGDSKRYVLGDSLDRHHHYAICERCGKSQVIENDDIEAAVLEIAAESNLFHTDHNFEVVGICAQCYGVRG